MNLFDRLNNLKHRERKPGVEKQKSPPPLPGGKKIVSPLGECVLLEKKYPGEFSFPCCTPKYLKENLRLLRGVGPVNEERLRREGVCSLEELCGHPRWGGHAGRVLALIERACVEELRKLGACDWELLSFYRPEEVVFLDIESTGLWATQPLFLVGILYTGQDGLVTEQYFARHYTEERAALEAVTRKLERFKVVVTYNGKRFDLPYLVERAVANRLFFRYQQYQVDLLYHARRHLRHLLPDCRLVTLEEYLLGFKRQGDIPGYLIPQTYHRYVQTGDVSLILPVLEHNRLDLLAMARLFHLVDPEQAAGLRPARDQAAAGEARWPG